MPHTTETAALYTSNSDEWYTPPHVSQACAIFLGGITLDPCADPGYGVPAQRHLIGLHGHDGLSASWADERVYVNPPFSSVAVWAAKFCSEPIRAGLFLAAARVGTRWVQDTPLADLPFLCFRGRVNFLAPEPPPPEAPLGSPLVRRAGATFDTCLWYRGPDVDAFRDYFDPTWGMVVRRLRATPPQPVQTFMLMP